MNVKRNVLSLGLAHARKSVARGFSLVSAIFLLVAMSALGAAIISISTVQHTTSAMDLQGARAYQAARAGIEWAIYQVYQVGSYCPGPAAATNSFSLPAGTTLSPFTVTVTCSPTTYNAATLIVAVQPSIISREVIATACNEPTSGGACPNANGGSAYVQRVIRIKLIRNIDPTTGLEY